VTYCGVTEQKYPRGKQLPEYPGGQALQTPSAHRGSLTAALLTVAGDRIRPTLLALNVSDGDIHQ
jgi:hypothetical protein